MTCSHSSCVILGLLCCMKCSYNSSKPNKSYRKRGIGGQGGSIALKKDPALGYERGLPSEPTKWRALRSGREMCLCPTVNKEIIYSCAKDKAPLLSRIKLLEWTSISRRSSLSEQLRHAISGLVCLFFKKKPFFISNAQNVIPGMETSDEALSVLKKLAFCSSDFMSCRRAGKDGPLFWVLHVVKEAEKRWVCPAFGSMPFTGWWKFSFPTHDWHRHRDGSEKQTLPKPSTLGFPRHQERTQPSSLCTTGLILSVMS